MAGQEDLQRAFQSEHDRRYIASVVLAESYAAEMGNWMRENARWIDRTGNARNSLRGFSMADEDSITIIVAGGGPPDYVKSLELRQAGKYAILRPCLEQYSGRIFQDLATIWKGA